MDKFPRIRIGLPTFAFFLALLLWKPEAKVLIPFLAAILHEMGHLAAMLLCRQHLKEIRILPFGIDMRKTPGISSYRADILVSSAGIIANLAAVAICSALPRSDNLMLFVSSNIMLILVNILPIKSLDGGQVLEETLCLTATPETAERVSSFCSMISILLLGSVAIWLLFYTSYNFTLLLMCIYLFSGIFLKR